jgi:hypothetical protein
MPRKQDELIVQLEFGNAGSRLQLDLVGHARMGANRSPRVDAADRPKKRSIGTERGRLVAPSPIIIWSTYGGAN